MTSIDSKYESAIRSFVAQIRQLAREELAAQLQNVVGDGGHPRLGGLGSPSRTSSPAPATAKGGRQKGAKRSAEEIASAVAKVRAAVAKSPGLRSEEIGPLVKLRKEDVADAILRLLSDKQVRKRGVKRATKYFPVGE
jgi:hypothetical protein